MARLFRPATAACFLVALLAPAAQAGVRDTLAADVQRALAPWPALQNPDGTFPDYLHGNGAGRIRGYDEAILGYALLMNAARTGDQSQAEAGFRAIAWAAAARREPASVFENMAMAAAYNFARIRFAQDPRFEAVRPAWETWLKQITPIRITKRKYYNMHLVEALAILELSETGLRSPVRGAVLNVPAWYRRTAARIINRRMPAVAREYTTLVAGRRATILSDPPLNPLAYHGLSLGFLARAIDKLGANASLRAWRLLIRMANGSGALVAPDGDLAYFGRSQEQAWALTLTAFGAVRAIGRRGTRATAHLGLADRAIGRLEALHFGGPTGFSVTPNLASSPGPESFGVDDYASAGTYTGLAMTGALWAVDAAARLDPALQAAAVGSDRDGFALLSPGPSLFATVRRADDWFVVRLDPAHGPKRDLRMDFGLVAWKARGADGSWHDALPIRPYGRGHPTAGPVLRRGEIRAIPVGRYMKVRGGRTVQVAAGGFAARGRLVRKTYFSFAPGPRRIRMAFRARARDHIRYSIFLPSGASIAPTPNGLTSTRLVVSGNAPSTLTVTGAYASGREHGLVRATLDYAIGVNGRLRLTFTRP